MTSHALQHQSNEGQGLAHEVLLQALESKFDGVGVLHTVDESRTARPFLDWPKGPCQLHPKRMEMDRTRDARAHYSWMSCTNMVTKGDRGFQICKNAGEVLRRTIVRSHTKSMTTMGERAHKIVVSDVEPRGIH